MREQLSIFESIAGPVPATGRRPAAQCAQPTPPRARRDDPETSQLAAAQVDEFSNAHYAKIKQALASTAGATIYELEDALRDHGGAVTLDHVQIARRLPEMRGVVATPDRRPSPSGRPCRVWRLI